MFYILYNVLCSSKGLCITSSNGFLSYITCYLIWFFSHATISSSSDLCACQPFVLVLFPLLRYATNLVPRLRDAACRPSSFRLTMFESVPIFRLTIEILMVSNQILGCSYLTSSSCSSSP